MTTASLPRAARVRTDVARVVRAGAVVGVLDGLAAVALYVGVLRVTTPTRLFQGIARALLGTSASDGGLLTAAMGLAMHFGVALGWAAVYASLYRRLVPLRRTTRTATGTLLTGVAYGFVVQLLMSTVLLPLTQAPPSSPFTRLWWVMAVIHMTVVGQPIAWIVRDTKV